MHSDGMPGELGKADVDLAVSMSRRTQEALPAQGMFITPLR